MKLARYGPRGQERPGLIDSAGRIRDLSGVIKDITPMELADEALAKLRALNVESLPQVQGTPRLGVPIAGIRQVLGIGLNYKQHAAESNMAIPAEPVVFFKAITSLSGPNDAIVMPGNSEATDWEVELAIVIGKTARAVPEANVFDYVAGYTIANDVSEREWQLNRSGQWSKGKSFDTFCPLGPWLVTRDEVSDPQKLSLELTVNGEPRQSSNTSDMIFTVRQIVAYCSKFMTLLPGDVIITGTPQGVGWGMKPRKMLKPGDRMRLAIGSLGDQEQAVTAGAPV
jgi:2,4-didehydro-3-deoxy-L-rhamnonate hydrolase